jgi:hypothetical protein
MRGGKGCRRGRPLKLRETEGSTDHDSGAGVKRPEPEDDGVRDLGTTKTKIDGIRINAVKGFRKVERADEQRGSEFFRLFNESLNFHDRGVGTALPG